MHVRMLTRASESASEDVCVWMHVRIRIRTGTYFVVERRPALVQHALFRNLGG